MVPGVRRTRRILDPGRMGVLVELLTGGDRLGGWLGSGSSQKNCPRRFGGAPGAYSYERDTSHRGNLQRGGSRCDSSLNSQPPRRFRPIAKNARPLTPGSPVPYLLPNPFHWPRALSEYKNLERL